MDTRVTPCRHKFAVSAVKDYDLCASCGTYKSRSFCQQGDYWASGHSSVWEQAWNVDMHTENGVSKNRFVLDRIESDRGVALEIGCAPGRLLYWLKHAARFKSVVGIEPDEKSHEAIRQIGCFDGPLLGGLFPGTPGLASVASGKTFDYVVALDVFEHCDEPERFLTECHRLMTTGGQLFLMLPLADRTPPGSMSFKASEHVYLHSLANASLLLGAAGFGRIKCDRWVEGHDTLSAHKLG